jgi:hypothetical protein
MGLRIYRVVGIAALIMGAGEISGHSKGWETRPEVQLQTTQGLMRIDLAGINGYQISVASRPVAELEARGVYVSTTAVMSDSREFVLLEVSNGGGSCGQVYRLLDLAPGQKPYLTREFGNCTDKPSMVVSGPEKVQFDFMKTPEFKAQTVIYDPTRHKITKTLHP